jgi:MFS family permease
LNTSAVAFEQTRTPLSAWYALVALSVVTLYALIDGQVLALLAQSLKTDLHLSDTQLGSLRGLGSVLFRAIAVVPLGWLADRVDRRLVLAACILVWSMAVVSCGLATGYWSLLVCMAFLAAGEAGLSPIVYALIPELFPQRQRMTANFIFYATSILGAGASLAIVGAVIDHIGLFTDWLPNGVWVREPWRRVFFVIALPGPFLAVATWLIRVKRQAPRARADTTSPTSRDQPEILGFLASHWKAVVGVFVPFGLALLGAGAVFAWLPIILMREFAYSAGAVGAGLGASTTAGSVTGLVITAASAKYLTSKWGAVTPVRLPQFGFLIVGILAPLYLVARSPTEMFLIAGAQTAAATGSSSLLPTVVQNLAPAHLRGRVFAISTVIATLFQVISPLAVGLLSDHIFKKTGGLLLSSIVVGGPCLLLAAATLRLAENHILKTVDEVQRSMQTSPEVS